MRVPSSAAAITRRLDEFRGDTRINAGSLIVTVFGDAVLPRGGRIWLGSLIRLLEPLGVSDRLVRTSVFRLVKEEWLEPKARGRRTDYRLTDSGRQRFDDAARQIYAREAPAWDRQWRLLMVVGEMPAPQRDRLRRSLVWQGFGELRNGGFVHPGADLETVFETLRADGMAGLLPQLLPMVASNPRLAQSASDAALVRSAWDLALLAQGYERFVTRYRPILNAIERSSRPAVDDEAAFLARVLMIHDYRRLLLRDPELPDVLLPTGWSGQVARRLCRDLYAALLRPSERHLDVWLSLADGEVPVPSGLIAARFGPARLRAVAG